MNQGFLVLLLLLLWVLVVGQLIAMIVWVIRRFLHRPRLSIWQGFVGLLVWLSIIVVFIFSVIVGQSGHTGGTFDIFTNTILLVQLAVCVGVVWYLYKKLSSE